MLVVSRNRVWKLDLFLALGLSYGISAFYTLPAVEFGEYTHHADLMYVDAREHLFNTWELLSGDFLVYDRVLPNFNYALLLMMFANLVAAITATVRLVRSPQGRLWMFFYVVLWGAIAAQFDFTGILWSSIGLLNRIQFPWRLNLLAVLACPVLFSRPLSEPETRKFAFLTGALLLVATFGASVAYFPAFRKFGEEFYDARLAANLDQREYRLGNVEEAGKLFARDEKVALLSGRCDSQIKQWSAEKIEVHLDCEENARVAVRQFDFVGRPLYVDSVRTVSESKSQYHGVIGCSLDAGQHTLEIYPERMPFERTANRISMGSGGLLVLLSLVMWLKALHDGRSHPAVSASP